MYSFSYFYLNLPLPLPQHACVLTLQHSGRHPSLSLSLSLARARTRALSLSLTERLIPSTEKCLCAACLRSVCVAGSVEKDLESILERVCGEAKRVLDANQRDLEIDLLSVKRDSYDGLAGGYGSWHQRGENGVTRALLRGEGAAKTGCQVAVHLIDPSIHQSRINFETLALPATWLQAGNRGGRSSLTAGARPDPFTLQAARTRSNVRSTVSATPSSATVPQDPQEHPLGSSHKRSGFSGLFIPLVLRYGDAASWQEVPDVESRGQALVGVMSLSRDISNPFTAAEELQLEKFCELVSLTLVQHLRQAQVQQELVKSLFLREVVVEVAGISKLPKIVHRCAEAANVLLGTSLTRILLLSSDGSMATAYTQHAGARKAPHPPKEAPLEQSLHTIIANREPLVVADIAKDARFMGYAKMLQPTHTSQPSPLQPHLTIAPAPAPPSSAPPANVRKCSEVNIADMGPAERRVMSAFISSSHPGVSSPRMSSATADADACSSDGGRRKMVKRDKVFGSSRSLCAGLGFGQPKPRINLVSMPLIDTEAGVGEAAVRGVVQVLHKRDGAFTDGDLSTLRQLCLVLARTLGHALKRQALIEAQAPDLKLLVSSDLDSCVEAALQHLRQATGAAVGCCYVPVSALSPSDPMLQRLDWAQTAVTGHLPQETGDWISKGAAPGKEHCASAQHAAYVDAHGQQHKFGLAESARTRRTVCVIHQIAEKAHIQQSMPAAWGYWKTVQSSLFYPLLNPEQPKQVMGVIHLANKADALRRGFDDVDIAKMKPAASKLSHAMLALSRLREAGKIQLGAKALSETCSALITAPDLEQVCQKIAVLGPSAFRAAAVRCFLISDIRRVDGHGRAGDNATRTACLPDVRSISSRESCNVSLWTNIGPSLRPAAAGSPRAACGIGMQHWGAHAEHAQHPDATPDATHLDSRHISILMPGPLCWLRVLATILYALVRSSVVL